MLALSPFMMAKYKLSIYAMQLRGPPQAVHNKALLDATDAAS